MKFIQTFHFGKSEDPFQKSFGWVSPQYHLMSWALSCLQLNATYKNIELYASSNAAKLILDTLELPYSNVHITHDNFYMPDKQLWALAKIFTYSLQEEPFIHLDGDVFLFDKLPPSLLNSELIAQNFEEATGYYTSAQMELMKFLSFFPDCVAADFHSGIPISAVNAGILGGKNVAFIKEYAEAAFDYVRRNSNDLSKIDADKFNVFFEQHLFYSMAKKKSIPIDVLFAHTIDDNGYKCLGDFHEVPCSISYLHLLGHFKRDEYTCVQMAAKLRDLHPEYYYKIVSLCKTKKSPLSTSLYYDKNLEKIDEFLMFNKNAKENYNQNVNGVHSNNNDKSLVKDEIPDLNLLQWVIKENTETLGNFGDKQKLDADFNQFSEKVTLFFNTSRTISLTYLYGRDLESVNWHCKLFANESQIRDKKIVKCPKIHVIESEFDWAGLLNKHRRVGVKHYEELELSPGYFFNLVVPEISKYGQSLFDLDELEKLILDHLDIPISINELLLIMQSYTEEDVIEHHLDTYNDLLITLVKQLVVKKAIKPVFD